MTQRPYVSFAEVKEKVSIPDVLREFGIADRFRESRGSLVGVCPLPQHQHGPRPNESQFRIDCRRGLWLYRCFGDCADTPLGGGDVINLVKAMTGLSDAHVRFWFHDRFGDRLQAKRPRRDDEPAPARKEAREVEQEPQRAESKLTDVTVTKAVEPLKPLRFRLNLDPHVSYLRERGVTEETIRRFGLGLCSRGLLKGYVAIPVYRHPRESPDENPVAYLGRWPGEDFDESAGRPRYKWPDGFEKSRIVYGLKEALEATETGQPLILVEGCFAVFHLVQNGRTGTVASFGASLSDEQADLLAGTGRPIIVLYDGNQAGRNGTRSAVEKLAARTFLRAVSLPEGSEPDDLSRDELDSLLSR